jgi:hypothetical protein
VATLTGDLGHDNQTGSAVVFTCWPGVLTGFGPRSRIFGCRKNRLIPGLAQNG